MGRIRRLYGVINMVYIGGASISETGKPEGNKAGDQTGKEVYVQPWYRHVKGWIIIRAKDKAVSKKIADDMRWACENDNIGYSYWEHCYTLTEEAAKYGYDCRKVKTPVETNCAKLVRVCALYAGVDVRDFYTGDEVQAFRDTGMFDIISDGLISDTDKYLREGDILVTRQKAHTVAVLNNGDGIVPAVVADCAWANVRKKSNVNSMTLETLKCGTRVELIDYAENGWGRILYGATVGYMSPLYLKEYPLADVQGDCWLRDKAGAKKGAQIIVIPEGGTAYLLGGMEKVGSTPWYEVEYMGYDGWASGRYVHT